MYSHAEAQLTKGDVYLTPHVGGYIFDGAQSINSDPMYGVGLEFDMSEKLAIEGVIDYVDTDMQGTGSDVDALIFKFDYLYHFNLGEGVIPYASAGLGLMNIEDNPRSDVHMFSIVNYGGGIKFKVSDRMFLRGDVRHMVAMASADTYHNLAFSVGLAVRLGDRVAALPPSLTVTGSDSDGDGVDDSMDKCPGTPKGVPVNSNGCPMDTDGDGVYDYLDKCPGTPAGAPVNVSGCPLDTDGDGVYDYMDKCPETPKGVPVNDKGCPKDSDGDGVYDHLDKCPNTPKGIPVDANGCPKKFKEKVTIDLLVEFAFDRAKIQSIYGEHVQKVANFLIAYPETKATIEGHTDSIGSESYNLSLSQKRANAVMKKLIEHGIDASRLSAVGYGESMPIADNSTKAGRQANRRAVATISIVIEK
ncbi:OmpA family protein [bacterium]|nr:OmpA family protein [bacterium]